jgi:hypothetical protein
VSLLVIWNLTEDNQNMLEIAITGTLRLLVTDKILEEVFTKCLTQEPISLGGYKLIIDPNSYNKELCPSENFLTYIDAVLDTR